MSVRILLIIMLISVSAKASSISCHRLIELAGRHTESHKIPDFVGSSLQVFSDYEYFRDLDRAESLYQKDYLAAVDKSIRDVIDPVFRSRRMSSELEKTLRRQHEIVLSAGYTGWFNGRKGSDSVKKEAGVFRNESSIWVITPIKIPLEGDTFSHVSNISYIEGIKSEDSPRRMFNASGKVFHLYPEGWKVPVYLDRMKSILGHLENCLLRTHPNTPLRDVLVLIADYYQVGINGHLFMRVNNSLLMSHVNYFLHYIGLKGLSHTNLDYLALTQDSSEFRETFISRVRDTNL